MDRGTNAEPAKVGRRWYAAKMADRPHHHTLILSLAAVAVSMISAIMAGGQYRLALKNVERAEAAKKSAEESARAAFDTSQRAVAALERQAAGQSDLVKEYGRQLQATRETIDLARQQLVLGKESLQMTQRPWISVESFDVKNVGVKGFTGEQIDLVMINSGNTPAYEVMIDASGDLLPFNLGNGAVLNSFGVLPPHAALHVPFGVTYSLSETEVHGQKRGTIHYKDAFGENYVTKYCYAYSLWGDTDAAAHPCQKGNSSN